MGGGEYSSVEISSKAIQTPREKKWEACQAGSAGLKRFTVIDIEETSLWLHTRRSVRYLMVQLPAEGYYAALNSEVAEAPSLRKGDYGR